MCCDHDGDRADLTKLTNDVTTLINSDSMISDRQDMIDSKELPHCQNCYRNITEHVDVGGTMYDNYNTESTSHGLKSMGIMLNTTCLYTCIYCTEHFSSSWYSDAEKNGPYQLHDREAHKLSQLDRVQNKISIVDVSKSKYYSSFYELLDSTATKDLSTLRIGGGEPLLYENLIEFIGKTQKSKPDLSIEIYTGLGVSENIFQQFLKDIEQFKGNLKIVFSQEGYGPQAEFMRYGTDWSKWENMATRILEAGHYVEFNSVLNNISLFTMQDFLEWKRTSVFKDCNVRIQPLKGPDYMSLQPLDQELHKEMLYHLLDIVYHRKEPSTFDPVKYIPKYENNELENLKLYIDEFSKRRKLDVNVLPKEFLDFVNG